jgi:hypothetical protein
MENLSYYQKWLLDNPTYFKEYAMKNREKLNKYHSAYVAENRKQINKYQREYYHLKKKQKLEAKMAALKSLLSTS